MPSGVEIDGAANLIALLKKFEPDLKKKLRLEMAQAINPIIREARGYVPDRPMRNWRSTFNEDNRWPAWNAATARSGIRFIWGRTKANRAGFAELAKIVNRSRHGAIAETAGRKNPHGQKWVGPYKDLTTNKVSHSPVESAGRNFIEKLGKLYGNPKLGYGRYIYRAYLNNNGKAVAAVAKAVERASVELESRIVKKVANG